MKHRKYIAVIVSMLLGFIVVQVALLQTRISEESPQTASDTTGNTHRSTEDRQNAAALLSSLSSSSDASEVSSEGSTAFLSDDRNVVPTPPLASSPSQVTFFCMQTNTASGWCRMLHSASVHGVEVHHPNFGASYTHAKRIGWVLKAVQNLDDTAVVAFNDGTDVLFNGGGAAIYSRFEEMEAKWGKSLFFNAEKNCYGPQTFGAKCGGKCKWALLKAQCIAQYRNTVYQNGTVDVPKWRYLNAGCFVGRVGAVKKFFSKVAEATYKDKEMTTLRHGVWCDQSMITKILLKQYAQSNSPAGLDVENRIYLPTYHLHPKEDLCPSDGSIHTCHNKDHLAEEPLIFHLNGKSEKELWAHTAQRSNPFQFKTTNMEGSYHFIKGKKTPLGALCNANGKKKK